MANEWKKTWLALLGEGHLNGDLQPNNRGLFFYSFCEWLVCIQFTKVCRLLNEFYPGDSTIFVKERNV